MDGIRLRVEVMPWQKSAPGTISEAPPKGFLLPPVRKELPIFELCGLIAEKFERLHPEEG